MYISMYSPVDVVQMFARIRVDKDDADDHGDDRGGLYVGLVVTCHGSVSTSTGVSASTRNYGTKACVPQF